MKPRLSNIAFELTSRCNLHCVYCYNIWKTPGSNIRPGVGSYRKSVKTLEKLFSQTDVDNVTLTGGEPFLAERLIDVVLFCRMKGKGVAFISNGTRGTEGEYSDLVKVGVSLFELPVHSFREDVHDSMTGVPGSWRKSVDSIKTIQKLGINPVVVTVLTRFNIEDVGGTLDFISHLGVKRVMINRYNIGGAGTANPSQVSASHHQLREAYAAIDCKASVSDLKITSNVCTPRCLIDPQDFPCIGFANCSADPLRRPLTLDMDGNIRLCNHSPVVAGNIFHTPLEGILHSPYARSWGETVPAQCGGCALWSKCLGGCRAAAEQCGMGLDSPDPILTVEGL